MRHILLLPTLLISATTCFAQLAPHADATLFEHLREVNREWSDHKDALLEADQRVSFADEAERIAAHLHAVDAYLVRTTPEGLSADQLEHRSAGLLALNTYADQGVFPRNRVLPYRNPIFIDPFGTACAVGQLMITSGASDLAARIDAEMETAYIREMHWPAIDEWANTNGFTSEELAWIQPGYAPPIPWIALDDGTNGSQVDELLRLSNGDLVLAGQFDTAGSTPCGNVARWTANGYVAMGALPEGHVNAAIEFEGDIYLGGSFNGGTTDLLKWNDGTWEESAVFSSKYAEVTALHAHNGALYAAGTRSGFAGNDNSVMRLSGTNWVQMGQELNGPIHALESFDGTLVAGGAFTDVFISSGNTIAHVARLNNNTWEQLGDGLNGTVHDLLVSDGTLYAAGDLLNEVSTYFGLARISGDIPTWEPLLPNVASYFSSPLDGLIHINALLEHEGQLFLGGDFYVSSIMTIGAHVAIFNGTADAVEPYAAFSGPVYDLELIGSDRLVACGMISGLGNIATTDLSTGIGVLDALDLGVFPNPTTDHVTIQLPEAIRTTAPIRITDATGRTVQAPVNRSGPGLRLDVRALAIGTYFIQIGKGTSIVTGRFTKQ
jgi:hypothetical protein